MPRESERKTPNQIIIVQDMINGTELGELVNISQNGIMIISDNETQTQAIFQMALSLPEDIAGSSTLQLGADCLWCRKVENFHRYWAGFQIIDCSDQARKQIDALLQDYSAD